MRLYGMGGTEREQLSLQTTAARRDLYNILTHCYYNRVQVPFNGVAREMGLGSL